MSEQSIPRPAAAEYVKNGDYLVHNATPTTAAANNWSTSWDQPCYAIKMRQQPWNLYGHVKLAVIVYKYLHRLVDSIPHIADTDLRHLRSLSTETPVFRWYFRDLFLESIWSLAQRNFKWYVWQCRNFTVTCSVSAITGKKSTCFPRSAAIINARQAVPSHSHCIYNS